MKYRIVLSVFVFMVFVFSCRNAGVWLEKQDKTVNADAIVILMGSIQDRVLQAHDLYEQSFASKVLIVETASPSENGFKKDHKYSNTMYSRNILISKGIPPDSIRILPGGASSTRMEASIIRDYIIAESNIDTLLLVSTSYHTRRASKMFEAAFKSSSQPVVIISSPSNYSNFDATGWWRTKEGIGAVASEYLKLVKFYLFDKWTF